MRICPKCGFNNEESFATCAWCNTSLAHAVSVPHPDPAHPDHEMRRQQHNRGRVYNRQLVSAVVLHSLAIAYFTLSGIGFLWMPELLLCSAATGAITGIALVKRWVGQLTAPIVQAALGTGVVIYFNQFTLIMFFTIAGYAFAAFLTFIWIEHIRDMNR